MAPGPVPFLARQCVRTLSFALRGSLWLQECPSTAWDWHTRCRVKHSSLVKSRCSLAGGYGERASGSSGDTAGFCRVLLGM